MGTSRRFLAAAVAAASVFLIASAASAAADTSGATACVDPTPSVFTVARLNPRQYQVSLADPATVTCADFTFDISSYRIPDTWDRNGWNETALPQAEFAYTTLTFPAGGSASVIGTIAVPDCGPYQTDIYTGPRLSYLQWPSPMAGVRLMGVMMDQAACAHETPSPSTSSTPAEVGPSTPAANTGPSDTETAGSSPASTTAAPAVGAKSSPKAHSKPDSAVLGTHFGALPHTGAADSLRVQTVVAVGLLLLGTVLLIAPLRRAPAPRRRH